MADTSSSAPGAFPFGASSSELHDQGLPSKCTRRESPFPKIPWITQQWLNRPVTYERIATGSPMLGVGLIGQSLLDHHMNISPGITSLANFAPVRDKAGHHLGFRAKIATWPLPKEDALKYQGIAA